jgi:plasmid maintenance system antidote protein VapI
LLNGSSSLTPEMALRMEKAFHLNMDMLLRMQAWYDATEMRKHAGKIKVDPYVAA